MGSPFRVLHPVPKPISILEFKDVLDATCRPRFPAARYSRQRRPALAISGGVDSMALAFLFSKLFKTFRNIPIADNPMVMPMAIVVNHALRDGSHDEALRVGSRLTKLGLGFTLRSIRWGARREIIDPRQLPNIESLARERRYETLGLTCSINNSTSLFLAHHQDDQYETLLMRLLSGHGYRGLQGMRPANDIPECHGIYSVSKSGLLEDLVSANPFLSFKPSLKEIKQLRTLFKQERIPDESSGKWHLDFPGHIPRKMDPGVPYLSPLASEDGGVMVYRPLLEFSKDRLIATCEANNVKWEEDSTNKDRTLTMRNAVRHIVANHKLPAALQKPAVLALSRGASRRLAYEEAEATRLMRREAVIKDFDPSTGTLVVELPSFKAKAHRRTSIYNDAREEARRPRRETIAALVVRTLVDFVTPESNLPSLSNLDYVVRRLFPELNPAVPALPHTAFSIAGVLFDPVVRPRSTMWLLSRTPYPSNKPIPDLYPSRPGRSPKRYARMVVGPEVEDVKDSWRKMHYPELWDGRYWVRLRSTVRDNGRFHFKPFSPEHAKAFRKALGPRQRARLEAILKHYAPGKVRYTLPALYSVHMAGDSPSSSAGNEEPKDGASTGGSSGNAETSRETLLALPTFGVHLPGLERWLDYDVSYKKVDLSLLGLRRRGTRTALVGYHPGCCASRRRRRVRQIMHAARRSRQTRGAPRHSV